MRAVVVELNKHQAAVLSDDGCVVTVKNNNYKIGQVIQISTPKINIVKKVTVFAASAAACLFLGVGTWAYASPYTYVSVDVNPSIEFTVNRFDRVIKVKAVNDDGEEILQEISLDNLTNDSISEAIYKTVQQISDAGYFEGENDGGIVIATSSEDIEKADELAEQLQDVVEEETTELGDTVEIEVFSVGLERVEEAKELGVTPGKLNLVEKLQAAANNPEEINIEEWLEKPVKDIMKATKEFKKGMKDKAEATEEIIADADPGVLDSANEDQDDLSELSDKEEKNQEKVLAETEKKAEKAKEAAAKAEEKAQKAQEKAAEKARKAEEKVKIAQTNSDEEDDSEVIEADKAEKEAQQAQKEADKAKKEAKEAMKAAEKAQKEAEKAQKEADDKADVTEEESGEVAIDKQNDKAPEQKGNDNKEGTGSSDDSTKDVEDVDSEDKDDNASDKSVDDVKGTESNDPSNNNPSDNENGNGNSGGKDKN